MKQNQKKKKTLTTKKEKSLKIRTNEALVERRIIVFDRKSQYLQSVRLGSHPASQMAIANM